MINSGSYVTEDDIIRFIVSTGWTEANARKVISWLDTRGNILISYTEVESNCKIVHYYEKIKR